MRLDRRLGFFRWGRIGNVHSDMPRTSVVDINNPVMSARSVGEYEFAISPNHISVLVSFHRFDRDLRRFLHLVGNRLLNFGLAFQSTQDPAAEDVIWDVEVCDLCGIT